MRTIRALSIPFLCAALALLLALSHARTEDQLDDPIVIRFSHVVSEDSAKGIGAELLKKRVEERLAGKVRVEVYPRSQKFTDTQVVTALLFGDIEMAAPSFAKLAPYAASLTVFDLPFLFPDVEAVHRFQGSPSGQKLLNAMRPVGIKGLAFWDNGMRVVSSDRSLQRPSDASGLSFRIEPSAVFHAQYASLGAVPRPMPFKLLIDALRQGLVNGQENTWSNIYAQGVHRFHKHFTELNHSFLGYMVITSDQFWAGLPPEIRVKLEQILAEVSADVNRRAAEQARDHRAKLIGTEGIEIVRPTPDALHEWRAAMCPVWNRFAPDVERDVMMAAVDDGSMEVVRSDAPTTAVQHTHVGTYYVGAADEAALCLSAYR
ncbi:MAG: DctP family TRAP transporter solute-binding subunit [Hyphomicrobiales bacterium]|nr:DctP family TRAP transporter solute-binding subunit [Hyphomicrobiales bacterium]